MIAVGSVINLPSFSAQMVTFDSLIFVIEPLYKIGQLEVT